MNYKDEIERDLYLRDLALGNLQGPLTGKPSIDKLWLKYYEEAGIKENLPKNTIYEFFLNSTKNFDDLTALKYYGSKITYKELKIKIEDMAKRLIKIGVKKDEIVTLVMPTCPETVCFFYALNKIGAVANFIHPLSNPQEFKHLINEVNTRILITFDGALKNINQIINETNVEKIITCPPTNSMPFILKKYLNYRSKPYTTTDEKYISIDNLMKLNVQEIKNITEPYKPNNLAIMTHTSGTTGVPKGAMLTNDNFNSMVHQYKMKAKEFKPGDTMITVLPPLASFMLCNCMHMPLCLGVTVELVAKYDKSDISKYLNKKYKGRVHMMGIPAYFEEILTNEKMKNANLSNLGYIVIGGAAVSKEKEIQLNEFFKSHGAKVKITKGYGETEITSSAAYTFEETNKVESTGIPLLKTNVKIMDIDTNQELGYNQEGEICFQTPTMMNGYYAKEKETNEVIFKDENGARWIKSGDLGYVDTDGILFVTGRIKRLFLVIGKDKSLTKAFPDRIEKTIMKSKYVEKCIVVGIPHEERNNVAKAYILLKENIKFTDEILKDIDNICVNELRETLLPYEYDIVERFPLNAIGKIDIKSLEQNKNVDVKIMKKVRK